MSHVVLFVNQLHDSLHSTVKVWKFQIVHKLGKKLGLDTVITCKRLMQVETHTKVSFLRDHAWKNSELNLSLNVTDEELATSLTELPLSGSPLLKIVNNSESPSNKLSKLIKQVRLVDA